MKILEQISPFDANGTDFEAQFIDCLTNLESKVECHRVYEEIINRRLMLKAEQPLTKVDTSSFETFEIGLKAMLEIIKMEPHNEQIYFDLADFCETHGKYDESLCVKLGYELQRFGISELPNPPFGDEIKRQQMKPLDIEIPSTETSVSSWLSMETTASCAVTLHVSGKVGLFNSGHLVFPFTSRKH